jgi:hypothetical protein
MAAGDGRAAHQIDNGIDLGPDLGLAVKVDAFENDTVIGGSGLEGQSNHVAGMQTGSFGAYLAQQSALFHQESIRVSGPPPEWQVISDVRREAPPPRV